MSDPAVFDDPEYYTKLTKERSDLEEVVKDFDRYSELKGNFEGNLELIEINEDPEITEMATAENKELKAELVRLEEELKIKLVPKDPEDSKNAIVEVRQVQVETKQLFLQAIYLICIADIPMIWAGNSKY